MLGVLRYLPFVAHRETEAVQTRDRSYMQEVPGTTCDNSRNSSEGGEVMWHCGSVRLRQMDGEQILAVALGRPALRAG